MRGRRPSEFGWGSSGRSSAWGSKWSTIRGSSAAGWAGVRAKSHVVVGYHVSASGSGSWRRSAGAAVGSWGTLSGGPTGSAPS